MKVDDQLIEKTATVVARRVYGQLEADDQDRETARRILSDVAWKIAQAERKRIAALVAPHKLDALAKWLDLYHPGTDSEVQRDLRLLASVLRGQDPPPASVIEALTAITAGAV